jgi:hypothetical protein
MKEKKKSCYLKIISNIAAIIIHICYYRILKLFVPIINVAAIKHK